MYCCCCCCCCRHQYTFTVKYLQCFSLPLPGPFKINACPLRRISQNFVIATSTKLDISGVKLPANINDKYFRRNKQKRAKKAEGDIFSTKKEVRKSISHSLLFFFCQKYVDVRWLHQFSLKEYTTYIFRGSHYFIAPPHVASFVCLNTIHNDFIETVAQSLTALAAACIIFAWTFESWVWIPHGPWISTFILRFCCAV